jgi:hypothetical protein
LSTEPYSYDYYWKKLPTGLIPATANSYTDLQVGGAESPVASGYFWYQHNGPLTLGNASIPTMTLTNRRVILFVDGDLTIQAKIKVSKGTGAFYAIVSGDIVVDPAVGHTPIAGYTETDADIEGLFYAEGEFSSGTTDTTPGDYSDDNDLQLHIRGSVAAGGFNLQRVLANNSNTPAEVFEFAPDMVVGWPPYLTTKSTSWREVQP